MGWTALSRQGTRILAGMALFLFMMACALPARAADDTDALHALARQYEMLSAELEQTILDIECKRALSPYPDRMLSHKRNAAVTIGGELRTTYTFSTGDTLQNSNFDPGSSRLFGKSKLGDLDVTTAKITLDARANRWRAFIDMNLKGYNGFQPVGRFRNRTTDADPAPVYDRRRDSEMQVGEAYIELMKDGHSGFGFKAGLIDMPFGLECRPDLIGQSFLDAPGLTGSYLNRPYAQDSGIILPHASRFRDPAAALLLSYEMRDIIRFEAGVFQDYENRRYWTDAGGSGDHYRTLRSESTLPLSHQFGVSILPLEGWELSATYRNRHSRSRGVNDWADSPARWDMARNRVSGRGDPAWHAANGQWSDNGTGTSFGSRRNEQAFTVGLAVEIPNTNLSVQLEYAHGWNQGFNKYINSDNVNFGLSYRLTPRLTVHGQAEWLHVKDKSWMAQTAGGRWVRDSRNNRLYRALLGAEYELARGLTIEAGWQFEYWNDSSSMGAAGGIGTDQTLTANMLYMGTRLIF